MEVTLSTCRRACRAEAGSNRSTLSLHTFFTGITFASADLDVWRDGQFEVLDLSIQVETLPAMPSASSSPAQAESAGPASPWIYRPWIDLLVGCGAWSAPLLGVAMWMNPTHAHGWAVAFYLLAIVFNYPHFMATIYRAYHTRADFEKYKFVTLHVTLLVVLTGIVLHASPRLFPWVFTLYICWSPWHYSGQNYGLLMMFVRRSGAEIMGSEKRWLRGAFIASYLMLLASFETGGSNDPLILSLGLPAKFTLPMRLALGAAFLVFTFLGFQPLDSRKRRAQRWWHPSRWPSRNSCGSCCLPFSN